MSQVHTAKGLIDRDQLTVKDIVTEDDNSRSIVTEWYLGEEMVKRDAHVIILRGQALMGDQAELG